MYIFYPSIVTYCILPLSHNLLNNLAPKTKLSVNFPLYYLIMFPSKRKRCDLTLQEKLDIISYHEMNKGKTQNELASYFSTNDKTINRTTISKIIKQKEELVKKSKREYDYLHMKRERETYYPTIENALLLLFSQARQLGLAIIEVLLKFKAMETKECLLEVLQNPEEKERLSHFSASNG